MSVDNRLCLTTGGHTQGYGYQYPYRYYTWPTCTFTSVSISERILRYLLEIKRNLRDEILDLDGMDCEELQKDLDAINSLVDAIRYPGPQSVEGFTIKNNIGQQIKCMI